MIIPGILFLLGLLCLIKGGDWFVDGASALARRFTCRNCSSAQRWCLSALPCPR